MAEKKEPKAGIQRIQLASHEWWSGEKGKLMDRLATECLRGENAPRIVEVWEHGGWWLVYALMDDKVTIVGSANDQAYWKPEIRDFWQQANEDGIFYLPTITRPERVKEEKKVPQPDNLTRLRRLLQPGFTLTRTYRLINPTPLPVVLTVGIGADKNHFSLLGPDDYCAEMTFPASHNIVFLANGFEIYREHDKYGRQCLLRYECDVTG